MTDAEQRAGIIAEISARLRPVCEGWSDEQFDSMVQQIAEITIRYRGSLITYDRRRTDRLIADLKAALDRSNNRDDRADTSAG